MSAPSKLHYYNASQIASTKNLSEEKLLKKPGVNWNTIGESLLQQLASAEGNIPGLQELLLRPDQIRLGLGGMIQQRPQDLLNDYARIIFGSPGTSGGQTGTSTTSGGPGIPGVSRVGGGVSGALAGAGTAGALSAAIPALAASGYGAPLAAILALLGGAGGAGLFG